MNDCNANIKYVCFIKIVMISLRYNDIQTLIKTIEK